MTSLITIGVLFIFWVIIVRVLNKNSNRSVPLSKAEKYLAWITGIVTIIWAMLSIISDYVVPNSAIFSAIPPYVNWVILVCLIFVTAVFMVRYVWKWKNQHGMTTVPPPTLDSQRPTEKLSKPEERIDSQKLKVERLERLDALERRLELLITKPMSIFPFAPYAEDASNELNLLVAEARALLGSTLNMDDFGVNTGLLLREMTPDVALGHVQRLASKLLGVVKDYGQKLQSEDVEPKPATDISIVVTPSLFDHDKLIEVYSPIHAMIVRVNKKIPREKALGLTLGEWVQASLIDFDGITKVFNQHNDKLGKRDFDMWLEITKEIEQSKEPKGFFFGKRRQEWFDELEVEYNRLKSSIEDSASGSV
jgi:hypothetical protein